LAENENLKILIGQGRGNIQFSIVNIQFSIINSIGSGLSRLGNGLDFIIPDFCESMKLLQIQKCVARLPRERIQIFFKMSTLI